MKLYPKAYELLMQKKQQDNQKLNINSLTLTEKCDQYFQIVEQKGRMLKLVDNDNYILNIETVNGVETRFTFSKYREYKKRIISYTRTFYANVLDFSTILKLIKAFVFNPQLVFTTYNEIMDSKKKTLTGGDVKKAIIKDNNLDEPFGKVKKLMRKVID